MTEPTAAERLKQLAKIVTQVHMRGVAGLQPLPTADGLNPNGIEGPSFVTLGLSSCNPSVPNHFLVVLESGGPISLGRLGLHLARFEIIAGECKLTCFDARQDHWAAAGSYLTKDSRQFNVTNLIGTPGFIFNFDDFPAHDEDVVLIESTGVSIIFASRLASASGGDPAPGDAVTLEVCTPTCSSGCPHHLAFSGEHAPLQRIPPSTSTQSFEAPL